MRCRSEATKTKRCAVGKKLAMRCRFAGFEAALSEVARSPMPLGVPVGVSGDEVLHAPRQVGLRCTEEEVEVVGHEHETEQVPTEPPDRLLQSLEQPLVVTLVLEDGSPEVATGHHVMDRAGIFDPQRPGHGPILSTVR